MHRCTNLVTGTNHTPVLRVFRCLNAGIIVFACPLIASQLVAECEKLSSFPLPCRLLIAEIWNDSDLINKPGPWRADNLATLHHSHLWLSSLFNDPRLRGGAQARLKRVSSVALSDRARPIKCLDIFEGVLRASSWRVLIRCLIKY